MRTKPRRDEEEQQRDRRQNQAAAEDERGWAGQHGQHPANEEEKNYRAGNYRGKQPSNSNSPDYD